MRLKTLLILSLMFAGMALSQPVENKIAQLKKSIAKVYATVGNGQHIATGFVMEDEGLIITALHVVAGSEKIEVKYEHDVNLYPATFERAYKFADLAALRVANPPTTLILKPSATRPRAHEDLYSFGYPKDIKKMRSTKFSLAFGGEKLKDIVTNQAAIKEIRDNGYPSLEVEVENIDGVITHGHSGAPIFDSELNEVVAIADGGLEGGQFNLNWAIPISYVGKLMASNEDRPETIRSSPNLFAGDLQPAETTTTITLASPQQTAPTETFDQSLYELILSLYGTDVNDQTAREAASGAYEIDLGETFSYEQLQPELTLLKRRTLGEIYATSDDQTNLSALLLNFTLNSWQDPYTMEFDIYVDSYSGATVVVPAGLQLIANGDVATGEWSDGEIVYICQVRWTATMEAAFQQSYAFEAMIAPQDDESYWEPDAAWTYTQPYYRPDNCVIMRRGAYQKDLSGYPIAYGYETLATNGTTFLGTAVGHENMSLTEPWTAEFSYSWAQAMIAVFLSSFEIQG